MDNRYSRQMLFAPIGIEGQQKIAAKHVLIVGAGALGTGNAEVLVRAGIGKLTIVDRDYVEWSNLQRQQLYVEEDAKRGIPKAIAAKERLKQINSEVEIAAHVADVTPLEFEQLIAGVDLILDATDNFDIRMIINDIAHKHRIPWIYGSCVGSYAISYTIIPGETPCLHCLMETVPLGGLTCDTAGIISPAANMVVVQQTTEALKIVTENWSVLQNKLVSYDLWKNEQVAMDISVMKNTECTTCGSQPTYPFLSYENQTKTAVLCGRNTVQIRPSNMEERNLEKIAETLYGLGRKVKRNPFLLSFIIDEKRLVLFKDGRALVHGTNDVAKAKTLYHQFFG
ncbi:thiamine biosynthesis protein MoeB [Virgibacillus phasianinus]|uniref:Thiamine biosynthesis protein MoeB n=1 Tax=Virgibacillus phasianinus TaxID=2017483 RepID=A0A220U841_9BACI|nr:thiazole biosynthesis adenylyltransferase ThiF [Virgibacillus phasianinus]ASK63913.1 thiamine biosynthesis protein MoeB [Virgibacillus phasianinus]